MRIKFKSFIKQLGWIIFPIYFLPPAFEQIYKMMLQFQELQKNKYMKISFLLV